MSNALSPTCGDPWFDEWLGLEDGLGRSPRRVFRQPPHPKSLLPPVKEPTKPADFQKLLQQAERLFEAIGPRLPQRINEEELGDALESIHRMIAELPPASRIQARIWTTLFWVSAHALQDFLDPP
ncbi:MAG TPA: hypothetical protein VLQ93_26215 [Myxococcaceae bacterium]|nr:hypothetical protein [Myxococcaceae bacterium]